MEALRLQQRHSKNKGGWLSYWSAKGRNYLTWTVVLKIELTFLDMFIRGVTNSLVIPLFCVVNIIFTCIQITEISQRYFNYLFLPVNKVTMYTYSLYCPNPTYLPGSLFARFQNLEFVGEGLI